MLKIKNYKFTIIYMNRIKLTIQNGHFNAPNGQTGTSGELNLIQKVFYAIKSIIDKDYADKIELSYDDANVKNGAFADYFIALHFDGATNSNYDGGFVDCNPDSFTKDKDWDFARTIADYYFNPMGIRFAPEHRTANSTYYYGFNYTGENTVQTIIELGTLTNSHDRGICQDYNKIARLLCQGIVAYLKEKDPRYTVPTVPTPTVDYKAQADSLRAELEKTKKEYADFQVKSASMIADLTSKCQSWESKFNTLVKNIKALL